MLCVLLSDKDFTKNEENLKAGYQIMNVTILANNNLINCE